MTGSYPPPMTVLPHSYPFVMLDKIVEFEEGKSITCLKNVSGGEEFFRGHFRGNPLMPGVLIIEAMAQASGLVLGTEKSNAYLTRIKDAVFRKPVVPGDQLIVRSILIQKFHPLYVFEAIASVGNEEAAAAEITLTVG